MPEPVTPSSVTPFWDTALAATATREPDRAAYVDASGSPGAAARVVTYGDCERGAQGWAGTLERWGVRPGAVVCLLLANSPEFPICYAGNARAGAVTSGVNVRLGPAEVASIVARTRPAVTVVEDAATLAPALSASAGRVVGRGDLAAHFGAAAPSRPVQRSPEDLVAVVWTSGTTGAPKGACFTHAALAALAEADTVPSRHHDVYLAAIPQAHVGFTTKVHARATRAATQVVAPARWDAATALALLEAHRVTVAGGVPPQWRLMLDHPGFDATDLSAVHRVVLGGASIDADLVGEIRERMQVPVVARYTCTELAGTCATAPDDPDAVVAHSVGRPLPGVELRLVDDSGADVARGDVGEVCSRAATMMRGYWTEAGVPSIDAFDADGFFHTGDLGRLRPDGNLEIVGRRKDMYVRGGYNVYPAEVESAIARHRGVAQCAVVGTPDARLGEIGVAFVVASDPADPPGLDDLRAWVALSLADYKRPDRVVAIDALPLTAVHKPDKAALAGYLGNEPQQRCFTKVEAVDDGR
ncbi:MAG: class I adenylate-forming enzyme family protein [Acidimicrobiia bacterium]